MFEDEASLFYKVKTLEVLLFVEIKADSLEHDACFLRSLLRNVLELFHQCVGDGHTRELRRPSVAPRVRVPAHAA